MNELALDTPLIIGWTIRLSYQGPQGSDSYLWDHALSSQDFYALTGAAYTRFLIRI